MDNSDSKYFYLKKMIQNIFIKKSTMRCSFSLRHGLFSEKFFPKKIIYLKRKIVNTFPRIVRRTIIKGENVYFKSLSNFPFQQKLPFSCNFGTGGDDKSSAYITFLISFQLISKRILK